MTQQISAATLPSRSAAGVTDPLFFGLVEAMFKFAVGDSNSDDEESFARAIRRAVEVGKADLSEWQSLSRPYPLADEIARVNGGRAGA